MAATRGDKHNFGQQVISNVDGKFFKPRSTFFEYLLLSNESPLLIFFKNSQHEELRMIDSTLSKTQVSFFRTADYFYGVVDEIKLSQMTERLSDEQISRLGTITGFLTWLGVPDLHSENILFGFDTRGNFKIAPIDVEAVFYGFTLPSSTGLLPSKAFPKDVCGFASMRSKLKVLDAEDVHLFIMSYVKTVLLLDHYKEVILSKIVEPLTHDSFLFTRLFVRPTFEYYDALTNCNFEDFSPSEAEQLRRGDIPYFLYDYRQHTICHYVTTDRLGRSDLSKSDKEKTLQLVPQSIQETFKTPMRNLLAYSVLQMLSYLGEKIPEFDLLRNNLRISKSEHRIGFSFREYKFESTQFVSESLYD